MKSGPFEHAANELLALAEKAEHHQAKKGTTTANPSHLDDSRITRRRTLGIVLMGEDTSGNPEFLFHKELQPKKKLKPGEERKGPELVDHRIAILGGGIESKEEQEFRETYNQREELKNWVERNLLITEEEVEEAAAKGEELTAGAIPPNLWYRLQGKHMLEKGELHKMTYPLEGEGVETMLKKQLVQRLRFETTEQAINLIDRISLLGDLEPRVTHVLNRNLGAYTDHIAKKFGMEVNDRGELVGICVSVLEHFSTARIAIPDTHSFKEIAGENVVVMTPDELIERAKIDTLSFGAWDKRLEKKDGDDELPIRNSSLLVGAAEALRTFKPTSRMKRTLGWDFGDWRWSNSIITA